MKTVRFAQVAATGGHPNIHLAWTAPAQDPLLQRALKHQRLMTLHQQTRGAKKDYGVIGFEPSPHAQYLIFPRSLRRFADRRIVGVQYQLFEDTWSIGPIHRGRATSHRRSTARPPAESNVVHFNPQAKTTGHAMDNSRPPPPAPPDGPVMKEVRMALRELRAGHHRIAERHLQHAIDRHERGPTGR